MFGLNKVDLQKVAVLFIVNILVFGHCIDVNVTSNWIPELGWQVNCTWRIPDGDRLQSVHLHKDEQQFLIYRPEINGPNQTVVFPTPANMTVSCIALVDDTGEGKCSLLIEPYKPPEDQMQFLCEVSGERPWFRVGSKDYIIQALVPPSNATVVVSTQAADQKEQSPPRRTFNCSSSGLPAPNLVWTIGEQSQIKADFTGRLWNASTKLWDVWSFLSTTIPDHTVRVVCSPEASSGRGQAAEYTLHNGAATLYSNTCLLGLFLSTAAGVASSLLR